MAAAPTSVRKGLTSSSASRAPSGSDSPLAVARPTAFHRLPVAAYIGAATITPCRAGGHHTIQAREGDPATRKYSLRAHWQCPGGTRGSHASRLAMAAQLLHHERGASRPPNLLRVTHLRYVVHRNCRRHDGPKVGEGGKGDRKALREKEGR